MALPLHYQLVCLLARHLLVLNGPFYCLKVVRVHLVITFLGVLHVMRQLIVVFSAPEKGVQALLPEGLRLQELFVEHLELPQELGLRPLGLLLG
jgi:hypothetical protein